MENKLKTISLLIIFLSLLIGLILYKAIYLSNFALLPTFFSIYSLIVTIFLISRIPYAYLHQDYHKKIYSNSSYPNVSIVIPVKNEEKTIFTTIIKGVESQYPGKIECIVINDGSTDKTEIEILRAKQLYEDKIKIITFPKNKGKREAMAVGINEALYEIIVFTDSDSFLAPDAIKHITEHFIDNPKIGAVSGNTKAENADKNILTRMESIQYAISFGIYKASESVHRAVTCCPGCFSAYRKSAILPLVDKWKEHKFLGTVSTFGDDRGLTNFVLRNWSIVYCEKAEATTIVPENFSVYWRQQLRWKKSWIREGIFAGTFMWKKNPLASLAFYINFSFPILGPILAASVLIYSIEKNNPLLFIIFMLSFILLGMVFALFVRIYLNAKNWIYMPLFSALFILILIWQMPYALLTLRKTHWGTR